MSAEDKICEWGFAALEDEERVLNGVEPKNFSNNGELTRCYACHTDCQAGENYLMQQACPKFTYFEIPKSDKQKPATDGQRAEGKK